MIIFKKGSKMMKKRILALCFSATFCLSVAAVQVTEDTTVSLTANSDTSYEIADGVTLTIDATGMTNVLSGCITGTGTAKLRKTGLGTLALSNANNSVPGGIFVDQGTIRADAEGALGDGPVTIAFTYEVPLLDFQPAKEYVAVVFADVREVDKLPPSVL